MIICVHPRMRKLANLLPKSANNVTYLRRTRPRYLRPPAKTIFAARNKLRSSAEQWLPRRSLERLWGSLISCLVDNVITAVHIQRFTGNQSRRIVREECGCDAHIVNGNETAARCFAAGLLEQLVELGNA